jgi:glucan phosphoethanolaminetransferase (alkaline phosphatase superfamily)
MGLYGYHRDTTPRLQARLEAADNHMVVFSDVISSHSHTVPALGTL